MLLDEFIEVKWRRNNRSYYEKLGYTFTEYGDTFKIKSKDVTRTKYIKLRFCCDRCQREREVEAGNYLKSKTYLENYFGFYLCKSCATIFHQQKSLEKFKGEVFSLVGDEYVVLGDYTGSQNKIRMKHSICGREWFITSNNFLQGNRCAKCSKKLQYTTNTFKEKILELAKGEYEVLGEYLNSKRKIEIRHNLCGNSYYVEPESFLCGNRCPHCNESKGEKRITKWLTENNVSFVRQYKDTKCKNKRFLPFDFGVFCNGILINLIEFDGKQHFIPVDHFGGEGYFNYMKGNDAIKDNFCLENNIKLIRIAYWDYDKIEEILDNNIKLDEIKDIKAS